MKNLQYTTTGSLFNHTGILSHAGDYAGKYQDRAFELIDSVYDDELSFINNQWCDIMHDNDGKCYAVFATDALTCQNAECIYVELEQPDCEDAFDEAKTHI